MLRKRKLLFIIPEGDNVFYCNIRLLFKNWTLSLFSIFHAMGLSAPPALTVMLPVPREKAQKCQPAAPLRPACVPPRSQNPDLPSPPPSLRLVSGSIFWHGPSAGSPHSHLARTSPPPGHLWVAFAPMAFLLSCHPDCPTLALGGLLEMELREWRASGPEHLRKWVRKNISEQREQQEQRLRSEMWDPRCGWRGQGRPHQCNSPGTHSPEEVSIQITVAENG